MLTTVHISNWYCPQCLKQVGSGDIRAGKHIDCATRVEWRMFAVTLESKPLEEPQKV